MRRGFAAALIVGLPVVWLVLAFFGGGQVRQCLGLHGCGLPPPDTSGPLDEPNEFVAVTVALAGAWLLVAAMSIRHVWRMERRRLGRALVVAVALTAATAVFVGVMRFVSGEPRRVVAEDAGLYALGAIYVVLPIALAWAVSTVRSGSRSRT